jgi:hypothetical protein
MRERRQTLHLFVLFFCLPTALNLTRFVVCCVTCKCMQLASSVFNLLLVEMVCAQRQRIVNKTIAHTPVYYFFELEMILRIYTPVLWTAVVLHPHCPQYIGLPSELCRSERSLGGLSSRSTDANIGVCSLKVFHVTCMSQLGAKKKRPRSA